MSAFFVGLGVFGLTVCSVFLALSPRAERKAKERGDTKFIEIHKDYVAGLLFIAVVCVALILGALAARAL